MSGNDPQSGNSDNSSNRLEQRLRQTSQRYQLFFRIAGDILNRVVMDRQLSGETTYSTHSVKISDFISVEEVQHVVQSSELQHTEIRSRHAEKVTEMKASELEFEDWTELNLILDTIPDRRDAVAQILALNESFAGFVHLLVSWVERQDDYTKLFALSREHGKDETEFQLELAEILPEEVPDLPEDDLLSATVFIMEMVEREMG